MNRLVTLGEVLFSGIGSFLGVGALCFLGAPIPQEMISVSAVAIWMVALFFLSEDPRS